MSFNQTLLLDHQHTTRTYGKIPVWFHLGFTVFWGTIVHFVLLWRCNKLEREYQTFQKPSEASIIWPILKALTQSPLKVVSTSTLFSKPYPVKVNIFGNKVYIIQGSRNMLSMLKDVTLSSTHLSSYLLQNAFGMAQKPAFTTSQDHKENDLNGFQHIRACNRTFLTGPEAAGFEGRFQANLTRRITDMRSEFGRRWSRQEDLFSFFRDDLTAEVLNALCGPALLRRNPDFLRDFWGFNDSVTVLLLRIPRVIVPQAYHSRQRALSAIKGWQVWARATFDKRTTNSVHQQYAEDEQCWTRIFRKRYNDQSHSEGYDADAIAAQELAFLYALNSNAIVATFWCALETFKDAALLQAVREEVDSCTISTDPPRFDIPRLMQQPLLQAIHAETLRLRGHGLFIRKAEQDVDINGWRIPKGGTTVASSTPRHMDSSVWRDRGGNICPPVDVFYPKRFLRAEGSSVEFTLKGTEGSWIPFGAGWNICPGRHFAKLQAVFTVALLVSTFDCELRGEGSDGPSMKNFGVGILGPVRKIPFWIRRRQERTV